MPDPAKKTTPKGGRKGGTSFPRISLGDALTYSAKLVAKTHVSAQSKSVVFKGVFDNSGSEGGVRASALKQFGLLESDEKGHRATQLAKDISAAPGDAEKAPLLRRACVGSALFKTLYETFHGDEVTKPKIRQQALSLNVHPESVDTCVDLFVSSLETAKLAAIEGDKITIVPLSAADQPPQPESPESAAPLEQPTHVKNEVAEEETKSDEVTGGHASRENGGRARATIQVNVTLDSSLDTEKLEKQLALLRKYGAL